MTYEVAVKTASQVSATGGIIDQQPLYCIQKCITTTLAPRPCFPRAAPRPVSEAGLLLEPFPGRQGLFRWTLVAVHVCTLSHFSHAFLTQGLNPESLVSSALARRFFVA